MTIHKCKIQKQIKDTKGTNRIGKGGFDFNTGQFEESSDLSMGVFINFYLYAKASFKKSSTCLVDIGRLNR